MRLFDDARSKLMESSESEEQRIKSEANNQASIFLSQFDINCTYKQAFRVY